MIRKITGIISSYKSEWQTSGYLETGNWRVLKGVQMNLTNPTQLSPNLDLGGPTWPNSTRIWTMGAQHDPKLTSNQVYYVYYRVEPEFEPYLRPTRPHWTVLWPWGPTQPDSIQILGPKLGSTPKNGSGLATLAFRNFQLTLVTLQALYLYICSMRN